MPYLTTANGIKEMALKHEYHERSKMRLKIVIQCKQINNRSHFVQLWTQNYKRIVYPLNISNHSNSTNLSDKYEMTKRDNNSENDTHSHSRGHEKIKMKTNEKVSLRTLVDGLHQSQRLNTTNAMHWACAWTFKHGVHIVVYYVSFYNFIINFKINTKHASCFFFGSYKHWTTSVRKRIEIPYVLSEANKVNRRRKQKSNNNNNKIIVPFQPIVCSIEMKYQKWFST